MKIIRIVLLFVIAGLGIGAGVSKILLIPEEVEFFGHVGFGKNLLILFGVIQTIGAILFLILKTRKAGAYLLAFTFGVSTIVIFLNANIAFGFFSLTPLLLIFLLIKMKNK